MLAMLAPLLTITHAGAALPPRHVMSISLCTDELLLDLLPRDRIASITYLAQSPSFSYVWPQAAGITINRGLAEEVLAERPDLVIAGTFTTPATRALLHEAGVPLLELGPANTFDQIRAQARQVAAALGVRARGENLIRRMDATLTALRKTKPRTPIRVIAWDGSHYVPGRGSLFDAILTAAGGVNVAAPPTLRDGSVDLEQVLADRPDVLAYGADSGGTPSLQADSDAHPLLLRLYAHRRVSYPDALYDCGVPQSADAARDLRPKLLEARAHAMPPLR